MFNAILVHSNSLQITTLCMAFDGTMILDRVLSGHSLSPRSPALPPIILGQKAIRM